MTRLISTAIARKYLVRGLALLALLGGAVGVEHPATAAGAATPCPPAWQLVIAPPAGSEQSALHGVGASGSNDAWAVGDFIANHSFYQTLTVHWNGNAWSVVPSPSAPSGNSTLQAVAARTPSDAWAVGTNDGQTLIEHWNGQAWSIIPSPNGRYDNNVLTGVAAVAANDAWAVGFTSVGGLPAETVTLHWNGRQWSQVASPNVRWISTQLMGVSARRSNDVWAAGLGDGKPFTIHWDGRRWNVVAGAAGAGGGWFRGVSVAGANDVWAVGGQGGGSLDMPDIALIEHWNGRRWSVVRAPANVPELISVAAAAPNDVWALTDYYASSGAHLTILLHWDGRQWTSMPNLVASGLKAVAARPGAVWAVGWQDNADTALIGRWGSPCSR